MSASCTPTLAHLQCTNLVLSTTATRQLAQAGKKIRFSSLPKNGASSRIWAYGFCRQEPTILLKETRTTERRFKMFPLAHQVSPRGWSIICLKLVLIFLNSLKPSHFPPSCFLFGTFSDKRARRQNEAESKWWRPASIRHVSYYHSSRLVTMSWRSPRNNWRRFSPHSDEKIRLFVPLLIMPRENRKLQKTGGQHLTTFRRT